MKDIVLSPEMGYVGVLFALFVVPRVLQRFGVPTAITSMALGVGAGLGLGLFQHDTTIHLLSAFGIVGLFLFAGLDVDTEDLRSNVAVIGQHLAVQAALLFVVAIAVTQILRVEPRTGALLALALLTPSTGFILDSIAQWGLAPHEQRWVKSKAIATELLALLVLFSTLQSTTVERLAISLVVLCGMIILLPLIFRAFAALVVPFAPRSEFAFLLMLALVCSFVTRELGVYYLVGAFVVGMAAQRFRKRLPAIASEDLLHAVEMFASFFVPFYFFGAGLKLHGEDLDLHSLAYGAAFLVLLTPLRILTVTWHRKLALRENHRAGIRIAVPMLPTLVFGLVIAEILRDRFAAPPALFGGLIVYTLATTLLPSLLFQRRPPELLEPHVPGLRQPDDSRPPADERRHDRS